MVVVVLFHMLWVVVAHDEEGKTQPDEGGAVQCGRVSKREKRIGLEGY